MDKREDTGNYYPGGTVVTGTPVPAPGGGGSSPVLVPCTVEETGSVIKIKPSSEAPQASYYAERDINADGSISFGEWKINTIHGMVIDEYYKEVDGIGENKYVERQVEINIPAESMVINWNADSQGWEVYLNSAFSINLDGREYSFFELHLQSLEPNELKNPEQDLLSFFIEMLWVSTDYHDDDELGSYWGSHFYPYDYFIIFRTKTVIPDKQVNIILADTEGARRQTVSVDNAGTKIHPVIWNTNAQVIEQTAESLLMHPGLNVWSIAKISPDRMLVDRRYPTTTSLTLSSPSGRQAQLSVNDELVLEVKEV